MCAPFICVGTACPIDEFAIPRSKRASHSLARLLVMVQRSIARHRALAARVLLLHLVALAREEVPQVLEDTRRARERRWVQHSAAHEGACCTLQAGAVAVAVAVDLGEDIQHAGGPAAPHLHQQSGVRHCSGHFRKVLSHSGCRVTVQSDSTHAARHLCSVGLREVGAHGLAAHLLGGRALLPAHTGSERGGGSSMGTGTGALALSFTEPDEALGSA